MIVISKLYQEGRITDEDRDKLKGNFIPFLNLMCTDMVFNEDTILMSLFDIYEEEEDLINAILKYCNGGVHEMNRPDGIDATRGDASVLDDVRTHKFLINLGNQPNRQRLRDEKEEEAESIGGVRKRKKESRGRSRRHDRHQ